MLYFEGTILTILSNIMITFPTYVTLLRIILTPFIVLQIKYGRWISAALLFGIAVLTDALDGALARYYNCSTGLGACLDALADKILLLSCFGVLYWYHPQNLPLWFLLSVMFKECCVLIGSLYVGLTKGWYSIHPTLLGKATTVIQFFYCLWVFFSQLFMWSPLKSQQCSLVCIGILMLIVIIDYARKGLKL